MTSLIYTAELDLAEPDMKPFLDWYAYRHAPDLVPLGFESSACYTTTGGDMNLFDIYEIPNHDLFSGAGYRRMNERDKYAAAILQKRRNKAHTIYRQHDLKASDTERRLDAADGGVLHPVGVPLGLHADHVGVGLLDIQHVLAQQRVMHIVDIALGHGGRQAAVDPDRTP